MAMDIIAKEKKSITWKGLPANAERNVQDLRVEKARRESRIQMKREHMCELLHQVLRRRLPNYWQCPAVCGVH
jgi:hypothetical protein